MSKWKMEDIRDRLRRFMASSGPAVIIAVPIVLIAAVSLSNSLTSMLIAGRTASTEARAGRSLLLSATTSANTGKNARANGTARSAMATPTGTATATRTRSPGITVAAAGRDARPATQPLHAVGWDPGGGVAAQRSAIRAQLEYVRVTTDCQALSALVNRGGLDAQLATAMTGAESIARKRSADPAETDSLIQRALQAALIASGAAPRDALGVVVNLQRTYANCNGDRAVTAPLDRLGALIRAQLKYSQPTATGGPGAAPIGNPGVPTPGGLGTATYLQRASGS